MYDLARRLRLTLLALPLVACSSSSGAGAGDSGTGFKDSGTHHDTGAPHKDAGGSKDSGHKEDAAPDAKAAEAGKTQDGGVDSGMEASACAPAATCPAVDKSCIGLTDNVSKAIFGLRMTEMVFQKPTVFTSATIATTLFSAVAPNVATCNLNGSGTFSWLLQFNTTQDTLTTGGALPAADPTQGYTFVNATLDSITVQPTVISSTLTDNTFMANAGTEVDIPLFLDAAGDNYILLPIGGLTLQGTVSPDQDCIGSYNPAALSSADDCQPGDGGLAFTPGGTAAGYITLVEADEVDIAELSESLCVLLSGNPEMYGIANGSGETVCARTGDTINFAGDWCSTTNSAASESCSDSMQISFGFAAGSVLINTPSGDAGIDAGADAAP